MEGVTAPDHRPVGSAYIAVDVPASDFGRKGVRNSPGLAYIGAASPIVLSPSMAPRKPSSRGSRGSGRRSSPAVAHGSRPEQVYTRLRDLIVQGLVAPGSRIVETEIASRLGVSRTPVREALQRLQQEGYVMGAPGAQQSRLTVAPLTRDDVHELLDIVGSLEGLGARRAADLSPELRKSLVRDLRTLNAEFQKAARTAPVDHSRLYDADERFHRRVVQAGEGPRLIALHDAVKPQAERYIRMYISMLTGDIRSSVDEHDAIINAIDEGRSGTAQDAVETNWRHAADRLAKVIETVGERGSW
jgi:DNA-binding GntR family transcriptional regulator